MILTSKTMNTARTSDCCTLYPWGKDKASISNVYMLSNNYSDYSAYYPKEKLGWFYLSMWQLSTDSDTDYWGTFNFWIDQ